MPPPGRDVWLSSIQRMVHKYKLIPWLRYQAFSKRTGRLQTDIGIVIYCPSWTYEHGLDRSHEAGPDTQRFLHGGGRSSITATSLGENTIDHILEIVGGLECCIGVWVQGVKTS